jgi:2-keto-4-pentenoate hydratase/2-oxohepta-3-ene-1,7-dioic acid hydratase in catechol pathway
MRFVTYQSEDGPRSGLLEGETVFDLHALHRRLLRAGRTGAGDLIPPDLLAFIERGSQALARRMLTLARSLRGGAGRVGRPLAGVRLLAPIPRPRKNLFCTGHNYAKHVAESGSAIPERPVWFSKPPTTVIGPLAPVVYHRATRALDYEVELAVVIGRRGREIPQEKALDYVFGYTVMNDVTARDVQRQRGQWFKGKAMDTFAPLGPWIVHRSAIPDPQRLTVRSRVNGQVRQESPTADMIFSVAALIADLSSGMTLEPGDIIATGTPAGVGMGMKPQTWLQPGDLVEVEVDAIGALRNLVVAPEGRS